MRFLLDMGLARSTAVFLRQRGHDAIHLRELGLRDMPDEDIVRKAQTERRIILTHDLDFGRIVSLSRAHVPSVITFRLGDMRPANVNAYLTEVLAHFAATLESGALISASEQGIRVRRLPVTREE
jgi:predicted nuclease of predicted toxin-antitoxin system